MSNVVQFLEAIARNPKLLSADDFATAVANAELEPPARRALLEGDATALNQALGTHGMMLCFVVPAENDEPQEEEEQEGEESPQKETSSRAA